MKFTKDELKKALTFYVKTGGDIGDIYVVFNNLAERIGVPLKVIDYAESEADVFSITSCMQHMMQAVKRIRLMQNTPMIPM